MVRITVNNAPSILLKECQNMSFIISSHPNRTVCHILPIISLLHSCWTYLSYVMANNGVHTSSLDLQSAPAPPPPSPFSNISNNGKETSNNNTTQVSTETTAGNSSLFHHFNNDPMVLTSSGPVESEYTSNKDNALTLSSSSSSFSTTNPTATPASSSPGGSDSNNDNARLDLDLYYKDVGTLKGSPSSSSSSISVPPLRMGYLDESITYNVYLAKLSSFFCFSLPLLTSVSSSIISLPLLTPPLFAISFKI